MNKWAQESKESGSQDSETDEEVVGQVPVPGWLKEDMQIES